MKVGSRLLLFMAVAVLLTACGTNRTKDADSDDPSTIAADSQNSKTTSCKGVATLEKPWSPATILLNLIQDDRLRAGTKAPEFSLPNLTGVETALYDVVAENEAVLINFWASWCAPCIKKIPALKQLHEDYGGRGFEIVSISIDSELENWEGASNEYEIPWIDLRDVAGISVDYAIEAIPASLLVDSNGCILHTYLGPSRLDRYLSSILEDETETEDS